MLAQHSSPVAERHGIDAPTLAAYVDSTDPALDTIRSHYGCGREAAKTIFLRLMAGSSERRWKADFKIASGLRSHDMLVKFGHECRALRDLLVEQYHRGKTAPVTTNDKREDFCVERLRGWEDDVLGAMEKFFQDRDVSVSVLLRCGLMVRRGERTDVSPSVLRTAEDHVAAETGFRVKLAVRDMHKGGCPFQ